jgi:DNA polymerase-3 subunit delta'
MSAGDSVLEQVVGQPAAMAILKRALVTGRLHHALLFEGPRGVGKETAAFGLAQALVCERRTREGLDAKRACGACSACRRALVDPETRMPKHPDVVVLETGLHAPERIGRKTPETQEISIDQVRALVLARAAFGPHEGRAKVFIIRRAEELSLSAANALLKTLEEPLDRTTFVLLSDNQPLLPTIQSRVLRVRFAPLSPDAIRDVLLRLGHGEAAARADVLPLLEQGSVDRALAAIDEERTAVLDAFCKGVFVAVKNRGDLGLFDLSEAEKKDKYDTAVKLEYLLYQIDKRAKAAVAASDDAAMQRWANWFREVTRARDELDRNGSTQLVLESMVYRMRASAYSL